MTDVPSTAAPTGAAVTETSQHARTVAAMLDEVEKAVIGKRAQLETILAGILAGGNVLLDDVPGVAKTLAARSMATAAGLQFARLQFTPDVLPSDITGATALDLATNTPVFRPGPIFAQFVLADEINRAPAKTESALLEAMQERRTTVDGITHDLPHPFHVIATQNPVESEGTYPLPEAQARPVRPPARRSATRARPTKSSSCGDGWHAPPMSRSSTPCATAPSSWPCRQRRKTCTCIPRSSTTSWRSSPPADRIATFDLGASPRGSLALVKVARRPRDRRT